MSYRLIVVLVTAATFAFTSQAMSQSQWDGFYAGLQGGYGSGKFSFSITDSANDTNTLNGLGGNGFNGGLFAGYGRASSEGLYVGLDVEGNLQDLSASFDRTETSGAPGVLENLQTNLSLKESFGASFKIGMLVRSQLLFYGRFGYGFGSVKMRVQALGQEASASKNVDGPIFGLGVMVRSTERTRIHTEYFYSDYGTLQQEFSSISGGFIGTASPSAGVFRLGWSFLF